MFCASCGVENASSNANYCFSCGAKLISESNSSAETKLEKAAASSSSISFEQFRQRKEFDRTTRFTHTRTSKGSKKAKIEVMQDVTIQIGIMIAKDGDLRVKRGSNLPLKVSPEITEVDLLQRAIEKHSRFNGDNIVNSLRSYKLLYPDKTEIKSMPGKAEEPFVLKSYKAELGKAYSRIVFYLCSNSDYFDHISTGLFDSNSDNEIDERESIKDVSPGSARQPLTQSSILAYANKDVDLQSCNNPYGSTSTSTCTITSMKMSTTGVSSSSQQTQEMDAKESKTISTLKEMFPNVPNHTLNETLKHVNGSMRQAVDVLLRRRSTSSSDVHQLQEEYATYLTYELDDEYSEEELPNPFVSDTQYQGGCEDDGCLIEALREVARGLSDEVNLRVKVRRAWAWKDFKLKIAKCAPDELKHKLKVQFVGEPAVDEGGPRRELFCLIDHIVSRELMIGDTGRKTFQHNMIYLGNNDYFLYGQCVALALLQGSPGPQCFLPSVASYILSGNISTLNPQVEEIPDYEVRERLKELESITDEKMFEEEASYNFNDRFSAGYCKPIIKISDKAEFMKCLALHFTVTSCQAEFMQFMKGLELHGVLGVLRSHPKQARQLLQSNSKPLTADSVDNIFEPEVSQSGSNRREKEEAILLNYSDFLEDVEKGQVQYLGEKAELNVTLGSVLSFITGATNIPAVGFEIKPRIRFYHDAPPGWKMTANTCANIITFPVNESITSYDSFKTEMVTCIQSCQGFGLL